jgi:hypothetical protein
VNCLRIGRFAAVPLDVLMGAAGLAASAHCRNQALYAERGLQAMRFMLLMMLSDRGDTDPEITPDPKAGGAIEAYNESLQRAGVLLALDRLSPLLARISFSGGNPRVTIGPFPESNPVVVRYWIIQSKSKEEAIEWARRYPAAENEVIEIRQVRDH